MGSLRQIARCDRIVATGGRFQNQLPGIGAEIYLLFAKRTLNGLAKLLSVPASRRNRNSDRSRFFGVGAGR